MTFWRQTNLRLQRLTLWLFYAVHCEVSPRTDKSDKTWRNSQIAFTCFHLFFRNAWNVDILYKFDQVRRRQQKLEDRNSKQQGQQMPTFLCH